VQRKTTGGSDSASRGYRRRAKEQKGWRRSEGGPESMNNESTAGDSKPVGGSREIRPRKRRVRKKKTDQGGRSPTGKEGDRWNVP